MKAHRYLVCGAGAQGKAIAWRLAKFPDTCAIGILDKDGAALNEIAEKISRFPKAPALGTVEAGPESLDCEFLKIYDVVISALPTNLNYELARKCLKAGAHYCDLGGNLKAARKIRRLHRLALLKKISLVLSSGFQPGDGNVFAKIAQIILEAVSPVEEIIIYSGGLPLTPGAFPYYKKLFNLKGLEDLLYEPALVIENGRLKYKNPLTEPVEKIFVEGIGELEALTTGGLELLPYFFKGKVKTLYEKTLRWPGFWDFVRKIPRKHFQEILEPRAARGDPDFSYLMVVGKRSGGKIRLTMEMRVDSDENFTSMEKATGFSAAIAARAIAGGWSWPGALALEDAIPVYVLKNRIEQDFEIKTRLW